MWEKKHFCKKNIGKYIHEYLHDDFQESSSKNIYHPLWWWSSWNCICYAFTKLPRQLIISQCDHQQKDSCEAEDEKKLIQLMEVEGCSNCDDNDDKDCDDLFTNVRVNDDKTIDTLPFRGCDMYKMDLTSWSVLFTSFDTFSWSKTFQDHRLII